MCTVKSSGSSDDRNERLFKVARASLFAAQAIARDLIADGRKEEVQQIREFISTIVPNPEPISPEGKASDATIDPTDGHAP